MPQSIQCPRCGLTMPVIRELSGQQVACPDCQHSFTMVSVTCPGLPATPAAYSANTIPSPPQQSFQLPSNRYRKQSPNNPTKWFVPVFTAVGILFVLGLGMLVLQSANQDVIAEKPKPNPKPRTSTTKPNSAAIDKQRDELRRWEVELRQREATLRTQEESRPLESTGITSTAPSATVGDSKAVDKSPATANIAAAPVGDSAVAPDVGPRPTTNIDGSFACVKRFLNENLNDPTGLQFISWSGVAPVVYHGDRYWGVRVKFRAKNGLGALRLCLCVFFIRNDEVQHSVDMVPSDYVDRLLVQEAYPPGTFPGEGPLGKSEFVDEAHKTQKAMNDFLDPAKFSESFKAGKSKMPSKRKK